MRLLPATRCQQPSPLTPPAAYPAPLPQTPSPNPRRSLGGARCTALPRESSRSDALGVYAVEVAFARRASSSQSGASRASQRSLTTRTAIWENGGLTAIVTLRGDHDITTQPRFEEAPSCRPLVLFRVLVALAECTFLFADGVESNMLPYFSGRRPLRGGAGGLTVAAMQSAIRSVSRSGR